MAESNANIGVIIGGDVSPLKNALKDGSKSISGFASDAKAGAEAVLKIGAAAGAAAAGGLAAIFASTSENVKELRVLAQVSNTTIEQFQKLAHGAERYGIEQEKLADILKDTNDRVGDFVATGGGPMADFFENIAPQIGVTVDQFRRLSGPEALQAYYNALEKANLNQQDMTFYMEAIASDSTRLIPLLKNNGAGFAAMSKEAEQLGIVMSGIDAAKIENAARSVDNAKSIFSGVGQVISVEMAPYIDAAVSKFVEMAKEAGGFGNIAKSSINSAIGAVGFLADAVEGARRVFVLAGQAIATFALAAKRDFLDVAGAIYDGPINAVNTLIDGLNSLPSVNIEYVNKGEFSQAIHDEMALASAAVEEGKAAMNATLMEPMPSESFKRFADEAVAAAEKAAQATTKINEAARAGGAGATSKNTSIFDQEDPLNDPFASEFGDQQERELELLKNYYDQERAVTEQHFADMQMIGEEFDARKFESEEQWRQIRMQAISEHVNAVNSIRENERTSAIGIAQSMGESLMSLAQGHSRKAFELGKKVSMASAVIKGYEAATSAWAAGMSTGGPWAPAVAASFTLASLAKTGAQIRAINSQSFGGGGGQSDVGGGSFPTAQSVVQGQSGGSSSGSSGGLSNVLVNIDPDSIITGRGIIKMIEEAAANGANISFMGAV